MTGVVQPALPTLEWPALVAGPVFLAFELEGEPGHKARHRSRIVFPTDRKKKPFIHNYPDPDTEAYEKVLAELAGLHMRGRPPTDQPVALLVHSFRSIPKSWSRRERDMALAGAIRPTSRPDWDNHAKVTDALNGVVWLDDSQVVDGRSIKVYSDQPALRVEVRLMVPPPL